MRWCLPVVLAGCSLHTPDADTLYRFRCEQPGDCADGFYCMAGYCTEGLISAGDRHTCMLRSDGTAACWGAGTIDAGDGVHRGQSDPLPDRFVDIAAGGRHTCGLKPNGRVKCWGAPEDGRTAPPDVRFRQISAGFGHTCGITEDAHIACWGVGSEEAWSCDEDHCGQAHPPAHTSGRRYHEVAAGDYHTCARTEAMTVECWGAGSVSSMPIGGSPDYGQATPPDVMTLIDTVTHVSAGAFHTCAAVTQTFVADVRVGCWGAGLPFISTYPHLGQATPIGGDYIRVAAGGLHSCGWDGDGELACWGAGTILGDCANDIDECGQADPPLESFRMVSAGFAHTCGIGLRGAVSCWGAGETTSGCDEWSYECGQSLPPDDLY